MEARPGAVTGLNRNQGPSPGSPPLPTTCALHPALPDRIAWGDVRGYRVRFKSKPSPSEALVAGGEASVVAEYFSSAQVTLVSSECGTL